MRVLRTPDERFVGLPGYPWSPNYLTIQDEDGTELETDQRGEICVCGPAVFAGYLDNPTANAKAFRNGWFRTG
ncbi:MAG: acyl-CoA synthetase, partial [Burkholderiales bacterium]